MSFGDSGIVLTFPISGKDTHPLSKRVSPSPHLTHNVPHIKREIRQERTEAHEKLEQASTPKQKRKYRKQIDHYDRALGALNNL